MTALPIFALLLATPQTPQPLSEAHMRDIGCIAVLGIIAQEQSSGNAQTIIDYADVREDGKRWAGIVGARVMDETGQPRDVVAFAIKQAVEAEQDRSIKMKSANEAKSYVRNRFDQCKSVMLGQLGAWDGAHAADAAQLSVNETPSMLATDPDWGTDEPELIARYRRELVEDLDDRLRIATCAGIIWSSHKEVSERQGNESRDAKALGRLARAYDEKFANLPGKDPGADAAIKYVKELQATESAEEQMARCIRLGEWLALSLQSK